MNNRRKETPRIAIAIIAVISWVFKLFFCSAILVYLVGNTNIERQTKIEIETAKYSKEDYIKACETIKYRDALRHTDSYNGKKIKVTLQVKNISNFLDCKYYICASKDENGNYNGDGYYILDKRKDGENEKLLEGDIIKCYGEIDGTEKLTNIIGQDKEVLSMKMRYSKLIEG